MKEHINKVKKMVMVYIKCKMAMFMKVSGKMINFRAKVHCQCQMEDSIKEDFLRDVCMAMEFILGHRVSLLKESIIWIKKRDMGVINGVMGGGILEIGRTTKDMVKVASNI